MSNGQAVPYYKQALCGVYNILSAAAPPIGKRVPFRPASLLCCSCPPSTPACGRFAGAQVQGPQPLTRRLRWFLVALVLVVAQGLSAQEALAQVRQGVKWQTVAKARKQVSLPEHVYGMVAEQMPSFRGGGNKEIMAYIQQNAHYPADSPEGRLFVSFTVDAKGHVRDPIIVNGLTPDADAEVIRVVKTMDGFTPGTQNGLPVDVSLIVPITFKK